VSYFVKRVPNAKSKWENRFNVNDVSRREFGRGKRSGFG
jgi:hypothetical protein